MDFTIPSPLNNKKESILYLPIPTRQLENPKCILKSTDKFPIYDICCESEAI